MEAQRSGQMALICAGVTDKPRNGCRVAFEGAAQPSLWLVMIKRGRALDEELEDVSGGELLWKQ